MCAPIWGLEPDTSFHCMISKFRLRSLLMVYYAVQEVEPISGPFHTNDKANPKHESIKRY